VEWTVFRTIPTNSIYGETNTRHIIMMREGVIFSWQETGPIQGARQCELRSVGCRFRTVPTVYVEKARAWVCQTLWRSRDCEIEFSCRSHLRGNAFGGFGSKRKAHPCKNAQGVGHPRRSKSSGAGRIGPCHFRITQRLAHPAARPPNPKVGQFEINLSWLKRT